MADSRTDLAVISGGLTSMLQPLDVCVNGLLKQNFSSATTSGWPQTVKKTPTGRLKRAFLQKVYVWILNTWRLLSMNTIVKGFTVTGISNALNGTDGDKLWERIDALSWYDSDECGSSHE